MLLSCQKSMQAKIKDELQDVWLTESHNAANNIFDVLLARFSAKVSFLR
ncbi:MAG: hypothetical protein ACTS73_02000 [Arsenophonus sp. NEOnobi-MAG3]